jgi:pimeloyl-ACP methyl ester carboxylesterase
MQYPYAEVQLRADGSVHDPAQLAAAVETARAAGATDVVVLVHGWNNDMAAARSLYERLAGSLRAVEPSVPAAAGRRIAVVGALWPSIRWADEGTVAGGGAGTTDPAAALAAEVQDRIEDPGVQERLVELIPRLDTSREARTEYLALLRGLLPASAADDEEPPPLSLTAGGTDEVFEAARAGAGLAGVGPAGGGASVLDVGGFLRSARNLLNLTTYYTMKDRAGKVGSIGIAEVLEELQAGVPGARLHLAGHSFGARAATAAAHSTTARVHSLSLLQAAFSHFGLATDFDGAGRNGIFRGVPGRLSGPVIITHTRRDRAVGLAYAIASRLARQTGAALGDEDDPYGGMGSNGAQRTPEAGPPGTLLDVGGQYRFGPQQVANLKADAFVTDHGDVAGRQVAYAVLTAMVS